MKINFDTSTKVDLVGIHTGHAWPQIEFAYYEDDSVTPLLLDSSFKMSIFSDSYYNRKVMDLIVGDGLSVIDNKLIINQRLAENNPLKPMDYFYYIDRINADGSNYIEYYGKIPVSKSKENGC